MNKWLQMIYDRVLCICRSVNARAISVAHALESATEVYEMTDFGIPAGARVTSLSIYLRGSVVAALLIPSQGSPALASGLTTFNPGPSGYLTVDDWEIEIVSSTGSDAVIVSATYYIPT